MSCEGQQIYELILGPHLCWEDFLGLKEFCMVYADLRNWQLRQHCFLPEEAASQRHQMCAGS